VDPLAAAILERLQRHVEGASLVLGGHFALRCYLEYRSTHDIDGWWPADISSEQRAKTRAVIRSVTAQVAVENDLSVVERGWGDTEAFDLRQIRSGRPQTVFSVQVAERDVYLDPPVTSPWPPILIETLRDNLGSKMNAVVARGAPRDFRDLYEVTLAGLATVPESWDLWGAKNPGIPAHRAKAQVIKHLESIDERRPLASLGENERMEAERVRRWARTVLAGGAAPPKAGEGGGK
jgi:hypothetical protein